VTPAERESLRAHLLRTGLSGDTRTTRDNTVTNARKLAEGDPDKHLGIGARGRDFAAVIEAVADLCGCEPDGDLTDGPGVIDPDRTLDELEKLGNRLERAAAVGGVVLIATGHPTGLLAMYQGVARALSHAGAEVITPLDDVGLEPPRRHRRRRAVRYLDGVAVLMAGADLIHTHESWPMEALLADGARPSLVLADHGFAGAAITAGLDVVCFNDVNDPAIAVARADKLIDVVVPLDDNLPPQQYEPLRDYLAGRIGRTGTIS
jgi:hypothetical protein